MSNRSLEIVAGALVLGCVVWFGWAVARQTGGPAGEMWPLKARFERVDGLVTGSEVRISGVRVGTVRSLTLDPASLQAMVGFDLHKGIRLPRDTSAEIASDGLLGGKYLRIVAGSDEETLHPDETIEYTQCPPGLEALISQMVFSASASQKKEAGTAGGAP